MGQHGEQDSSTRTVLELIDELAGPRRDVLRSPVTGGLAVALVAPRQERPCG